MNKIFKMIIILCFLCVINTTGNNKYDLKMKYMKGNKFIIERESTANTVFSCMGGEVYYERKRYLKIEETILEVDSSYIPIKVMRKIDSYKEYIKDCKSGTEEENSKVSLADVEFVMTKEKETIKVDLNKNDYGWKINRFKFVDMLNEIYGCFLPENKVSINEEWSIDLKSIEKYFLKYIADTYHMSNSKLIYISGTVKGKLEKIEKRGKITCAIISIGFNNIEMNYGFRIEAEGSDDFEERNNEIYKYEGKLVLELDIKNNCMISHTFKGKIMKHNEGCSIFALGDSKQVFAGTMKDNYTLQINENFLLLNPKNK